jgi:hypothetical protein
MLTVKKHNPAGIPVDVFGTLAELLANVVGYCEALGY